jgi:hypothetical protein
VDRAVAGGFSGAWKRENQITDTVTILGRGCQRIDLFPIARYIILMSSAPIRIITILVATLLIAGGAYTAYWYSAAAELRDGMKRWAEDRRSAGWSIDLGNPDITGFPMRLEVFFQTPRISGPGSQWRWVSPNISASAAPWSPREIAVSAPGIHVVTLRAGDLWVELDEAEADIVVGKRQVKNVIGRLSGIRLRLPAGERINAGSAIVRLLDSVAADPEKQANASIPGTVLSDTGLGLALDLQKITLPQEWRPALGRNVGKIALDAVIMGEVVPAGPLKDSLVRWRNNGGTVEVSALALDWGVLRLRANGTFALDEDLQPEGAMVADLRGVDETIERLLGAGVIESRAAFAARLANRALAFGGGSARVPLTLQKQRLFIGPAPVLRIKPVNWN